MNPQIQGLDQLEGTYVFDLRISNRTLNLNRFLWNMIRADWRARFLQNEEEAMKGAGLSEQECALVRACDWLGLVKYGANFFVIDKFARVVKKTNLEVYAIMRGETFEEFMNTRLVPDAR